MYINEPLRKYLDEAAARLSTPGGGSVSALAGALGAAMLSMVANFTMGKKKYENVEKEVSKILFISENLREKLTRLGQLDIESYKKVSAVYGKVALTEKEKEEKTYALEKACEEALEVPLESAKYCYRILELSQQIVEIGNKNLISDVGVAVVLAMAGLEGAVLNVKINLKSVKDEKFKRRIEKVFLPLLKEGEEIKKEVLRKVKEKIK